MRILIIGPVAMLMLAACGSRPSAGPLGEGMSGTPRIVAVDSAHPPASATVALEQSAFVAILLVAPGHSATLLYPGDSATTNLLTAGESTVRFEIPGVLVRNDSVQLVRRRAQRMREDSVRLRARAQQRTHGLTPLPPDTPTYLLLVTSPQPLAYERIIEKTAGVSIPLVHVEALNAVGKAVRSTLADEPRTLAGYYQLVELARDQ